MANDKQQMNSNSSVVTLRSNFVVRITYLFIFFNTFHCYSINVQDSIRTIRESITTDSVKIERLAKLTQSNTATNSDKTEVIFAMMELSEEITSIKDVARSFYVISLTYNNLQYFDNALEYGLRCARAYEQANNRKGMANIYNLLGNIYTSKASLTNDTIYFSRSIDYHLKNIELRKELNDTAWFYNSHINISFTYMLKGDFDKAIEYAMIPHEYHTRLQIDQHAIGLTSESLGDSYYGKARTTGNQQFYEKALSYYDFILNEYVTSNSDPGYIHALQKVGEIYAETGQPDRGLDYLLKAYDLYEQTNDKEGISSSALILAKIFSKKNSNKKSNEFLWTHLAYKDSLLNEKSRVNFEQMQAIYKSSEKEKEIQSLQKDKEKQAALTEAGNNRRNIIIISAIAGMILLLVFMLFILNRFKVTREQKRIIEIQKETVDANQKKIIDSINYAKKIQYSILPSNEEIDPYFQNYFVLFKPKDIVSGDFYWFHHENDLSFLAVVDCTGHGVPGAFMTMIAHSILIEVVVEQKTISPEKILNNLHSLVFKNLQQQKGDEYSQDGMDISLVVIDHKKNLVHFSGARNNAFLVDDSEVKILKATQKSIGGLSLLGEIEPSREFKSETVPLKKESLLILSTDGFFDQLNEEDEKFGISRFKEMILSVKTTNGTSKSVEQTYQNWKGNAPQQDDILLVGVRL